MNQFKVCDLFSLESPEGLQFYIEAPSPGLSTEILYFSRGQSQHYGIDSSLVGSIELVSGESEEIEELIHAGVSRQVLTLDGFVSDASEDANHFGFSCRFNVDGDEFTQHHSVITTGAGYSVHLCFLQGHSERDIEELEMMLSKASFIASKKHIPIGEYLTMQFDEDAVTFKIGNRSHLSVGDAVLRETIVV